MSKKKRLQELTIKDNFMFGAVMTDVENCRLFLQMVLNIPIERVEVSKERSIIYHPEYRGVRLDIYAKDEKNTHYNVEMQVSKEPALPRRARYYHSQITADLLLSGTDYSELPDTYVIFICNYGPFGERKYMYSFESCCTQDGKLFFKDGTYTICLSTCGENEKEVPKELVKFLAYVGADLKKSTNDFGDDFVARLQKSVHQVKASREMEERYMLFEELLKNERKEGREEGRKEGRKEGRVEDRIESITELLESLGMIPEALKERIESEKNLNTLKAWYKIAIKAESIDQFMQEIQ